MLRGWDGSVRPAHSASRAARARPAFLQAKETVRDLPSEKSWENLAAMQHIYRQGRCGSCWAISTATVLEAHAEINGHSRTFSAQQIVSCTPNPRECGGAGKCEGATIELAMDWVLHNGCAETSKVPYKAENGQCDSPDSVSLMAQRLELGEAPPLSGAAAFGMTGWEMLPQNEQEPLKRALVERGPVGVSVGANDWKMYSGGVFDGCTKDAIIDHAVVLIGYGEDGSNPYWTIQNSWGNDWGESGRIRLLRQDADDYCGMDDKPQLGTACKGETDPVKVCGMCGVLYDSVVPHFNSL